MEHIFQERVVAFLDVLGFRQKLSEFENEAKNYKNYSEDAEYGSQYYSENAHIFIETFNAAVGKLNKDKYRHYLFSDNICITSIEKLSPADIQDLLLVISE